MYSVKYRPSIDEKFAKMAKKDPKRLEAIMKKLPEILGNPFRFKPLSNTMKGIRRVHFGHFVLTYTVDEANRTVILEDYDHHDKIYRK